MFLLTATATTIVLFLLLMSLTASGPFLVHLLIGSKQSKSQPQINFHIADFQKTKWASLSTVATKAHSPKLTSLTALFVTDSR